MSELANEMFRTVHQQLPPFQCPHCQKTSHLQTDREEGYCPWCHAFVAKRTRKGFTVVVTRAVIAETDTRIATIAAELAAGGQTDALDISLATYRRLREEFVRQLRDVGEEIDNA